MEYSIERLTKSNHQEVVDLLDVFGECFDESEIYCEKKPTEGYIELLLDSPSIIVLVAKHQQKVIGGLVAYELKKLEKARSEIYIYDLAVTQEFRRNGVATNLISALQPIAHDFGAWVIYVQADYVDPPAIALYSKLGVKEEVLHFDIPVVKVPTST